MFYLPLHYLSDVVELLIRMVSGPVDDKMYRFPFDLGDSHNLSSFATGARREKFDPVSFFQPSALAPQFRIRRIVTFGILGLLTLFLCCVGTSCSSTLFTYRVDFKDEVGCL